MVDYVAQGKKNRRKGTEYERKVAREMSKLTGQVWRRTPYSGAAHISGDIFRLSPTPFPFTVELKNRADITLDKIFRNPNCIWELVNEQILIFNNHGQDLVVLSEYILPLPEVKPPYIASYIFFPGDEDYRIITLHEFAKIAEKI